MVTAPLRSVRKVRDVMAREVISIDKDERLERALQVMEKHNVTKIPITEDGKYVGIVTDGEIADELGALKNAAKPASALHASGAMVKDVPTTHPDADIEEIIELAQTKSVTLIPVLHDRTLVGVVTKADLLPLVTSDRPLRDLMITQLHAVAPSDRVVHARRMMLDHHVERLPVLAQGDLAGIVTETDVAFGFAKFKARVAQHHQAAQLKQFLVEDIMVRKVVSGTADMTASEAAALMRERHVGGLPIVANGAGRIAGMVTRTDLIRTIEI